MPEINKYESSRDRLANAKRKLENAIPDAIDSMISLSQDARAEPVRLQAIKAVLEQNEVYRKEEAEAQMADLNGFIDQQIVYLLKELSRKNTFIEIMRQVGAGASPDDIVKFREQTDEIFGIGSITEDAVVILEDEEED
jgi:hypothetical protein